MPTRLFDTELAGRLLGYPRVGLATLVESRLGYRLGKEHSAVDWSTRPLPEPWLEYAALDVEVLVELRDVLVAELEEPARPSGPARSSTTCALRADPPGRGVATYLRAAPRARPPGAGRRPRPVGDPRRAGRAARRHPRPDPARRRDRRRRPRMPADKAALLATKGFHGRGAERYANRWVAALTEAATCPRATCPPRTARRRPPVARAWADHDPVAARRLTLARQQLTELAEQHHLPVENVLTPDTLRRTLWTPPRTRDEEPLTEAVRTLLAGYAARPWQIDLTTPILVSAILEADKEPPPPDPDEVAD